MDIALTVGMVCNSLGVFATITNRRNKWWFSVSEEDWSKELRDKLEYYICSSRVLIEVMLVNHYSVDRVMFRFYIKSK